MDIQLKIQVLDDGVVALAWQADSAPDAWALLIERTGRVPAHTALRLSARTTHYRIEHLGQHQRYRFCVLGLPSAGPATGEPTSSTWWTVTPRTGLRPLPDEGADLESHLVRARDLLVMPQHERLTAWWKLTDGFIDQVALELWQPEESRLLARLELEPEVTSLSLTAERGLPIRNGQACQIRLRTGFAGLWTQGPPPVICAPAIQGQEREVNRCLPQQGLVYPSLGLAEELTFFDDDPPQAGAPGELSQPAAAILCIHCRSEVHWDAWRLRCSGCQAEFIPNGRGSFLDVARLRFGTCSCCLPPKILIARAGQANLRCVHSGKEHIRIPGQDGFSLIEDLPFGLCQCCPEPRNLIGHPALDASRLMCPQTRRVHLDRGDGLFELEIASANVTRLELEPEPAADVTSDRPVRTGPKTRIELERATFA